MGTGGKPQDESDHGAAHHQGKATPSLAMRHPYTVWMDAALQQADAAATMGEVPVGALVLFGDEIIAWGHNQKEARRDPLAHAEICVIQAAARALGRWRLTGCTLVVTLEPCFMCAGALVNARIERLIFGAYDVRGGAVGSLSNVPQDPRLNHRVDVVGGVQAAGCAARLTNFFALRRGAVTQAPGERAT